MNFIKKVVQPKYTKSIQEKHLTKRRKKIKQIMTDRKMKAIPSSCPLVEGIEE
jgi:hypothetical protein